MFRFATKMNWLNLQKNVNKKADVHWTKLGRTVKLKACSQSDLYIGQNTAGRLALQKK